MFFWGDWVSCISMTADRFCKCQLILLSMNQCATSYSLADDSCEQNAMRHLDASPGANYLSKKTWQQSDDLTVDRIISPASNIFKLLTLRYSLCRKWLFQWSNRMSETEELAMTTKVWTNYLIMSQSAPRLLHESVPPVQIHSRFQTTVRWNTEAIFLYQNCFWEAKDTKYLLLKLFSAYTFSVLQ